MQLPYEFTMSCKNAPGRLFVAVRKGPVYHIRDSRLSFEKSEARGEYGMWNPGQVEEKIQNGIWLIMEYYDEPSFPDVHLEEVL